MSLASGAGRRTRTSQGAVEVLDGDVGERVKRQLAKRIDFRLVDTFGTRVPIRGTVPFPRGALTSAAHVVLRDSNQVDIAFDAADIARWDDGSIRWLRLDFVAPKDQKRLALHYGTDVNRTSESRLKISEDADTYFVNTGMLEFELGKGTFSVLANCSVVWGGRKAEALRPQGIELLARDYFRRGYCSSADGAEYSCNLEEHGDNHAVFNIRGSHRDKRGKLFDFEMRLHCQADSAVIRLSHVLRSRQEEELPAARAVEIQLPLSDSPLVFSSGIESGYSLEHDLIDEAVLTQTGPTRMKPGWRFQYCHNGTMVGRRGEGWMTASGEVVGVTAAVRRFWQQHPKGFRLSSDEMAVQLWPAEAEELMVLPRGCEKTHEVLLLFHGVRDADLADASLVGRAFTRPPAMLCTPSWYCGCAAMGELTPAGSRGFEQFGKAAAGAFAALKKRRSNVREYGDFDYGDFADLAQVDGWFNVEYDTPHCLLTQFARTAKRDYLDWGIDAAIHQGDIDMAHFVPTDPNLVGSQSIHATAHLGRASKWFYHRTDHIWAQGLVKAYWLTGDRRHLDNAILVGDYLARVKPCPVDQKEERPYAWSLIGLMAVYEATLDEKYLTAAGIIAEEALAMAHPERGLWLREWGADKCGKPLLGSSPFMSGLLVEGLIEYDAVADNPQIDDFIVKAVRTWINEAWIEEESGFYYHPGLDARDHGRPADCRQLLGLIHAYELTSDREILDIAIKNFTAAVRCHLASIAGKDVKGGAAKTAKNYAIFLRTTPRFIAALSRLGIRLPTQ